MYRLQGLPADSKARPLLMHHDLAHREEEQVELCRTKVVPDIATVNIDVLDSAISLQLRDVSHTFTEQLATIG